MLSRKGAAWQEEGKPWQKGAKLWRQFPYKSKGYAENYTAPHVFSDSASPNGDGEARTRPDRHAPAWLAASTGPRGQMKGPRRAGLVAGQRRTMAAFGHPRAQVWPGGQAAPGGAR